MNTMIVYYGMDVAKATLELAGPTGGLACPNTPRGHAQLLAWLVRQPGPAHVVGEATGGYERAVVATLQAAAITVSVINPRQAREFARARVRLLERHAEQIQEQIADVLAEHRALADRAARLEQVCGIGRKTAVSLLAFLPELGRLRHGQAAALAGVAPYNRDSGKWRGKRMIWGRRPAARRALYMAAVAASRFNPVLAPFYQRLIGRGKPTKVARTAVMRKLVEHANRLLAQPQNISPCTP